MLVVGEIVVVIIDVDLMVIIMHMAVVIMVDLVGDLTISGNYD